jgi:hypothetical protein
MILRVGAQNIVGVGGGTTGIWTTNELLHTPGADWDGWYETAFELVPEAGSAIEQLASLVSGFEFIAKQNDQESVDLLNGLIGKSGIALRKTMLDSVWNYYTYGRSYIQPVWNGTIRSSDILSLRTPQPTTMQPVHATERELEDFLAAYDAAKVAKPPGIEKTKLNGDVIGVLQKITGLPAQPYLATEMIFIPRSTPKYPDGVSVLRNLYRKMVAVGGSEEMLARLTRTFAHPPWYFKVGSPDYPCEPNATGQKMIDFVKNQIGPLTEAGEYENITEIILPNWVEFILPRFDVPIAAPLMGHVKDERDAILVSIGVPPAIMSAEGYRSTAHEALTFLEDRIQPIRDLFERRLTDDLLKPWLTFMHKGAAEGTSWFMPDWAWKDITPSDMAALRLSLVQASGGGFMTRDEARMIHGGLSVVENLQQPPSPTQQPAVNPTQPQDQTQPSTSPPQTEPTIQGMTPKMLEDKYRKPLKQIITEAMYPENHPQRSHRAASRILGVSPTTLYKWRRNCGLWP